MECRTGGGCGRLGLQHPALQHRGRRLAPAAPCLLVPSLVDGPDRTERGVTAMGRRRRATCRLDGLACGLSRDFSGLWRPLPVARAAYPKLGTPVGGSSALDKPLQTTPIGWLLIPRLPVEELERLAWLTRINIAPAPNAQVALD